MTSKKPYTRGYLLGREIDWDTGKLKQTSEAIATGDKRLLDTERKATDKHSPIASKFPKCEEYKLKTYLGGKWVHTKDVELALSKAEEKGMFMGSKTRFLYAQNVIKKKNERIKQLETKIEDLYSELEKSLGR